MFVTKKSGLFNAGLLWILFGIVAYSFDLLFIHASRSGSGISLETCLSHLVLIFAIFFMVLGIYCWVQALVIKDY